MRRSTRCFLVLVLWLAAPSGVLLAQEGLELLDGNDCHIRVIGRSAAVWTPVVTFAGPPTWSGAQTSAASGRSHVGAGQSPGPRCCLVWRRGVVDADPATATR